MENNVIFKKISKMEATRINNKMKRWIVVYTLPPRIKNPRNVSNVHPKLIFLVFYMLISYSFVQFRKKIYKSRGGPLFTGSSPLLNFC